MRARSTDPETSQRALAELDWRQLGIYEQIVRWAAFAFDQGKPFTDSFLARRIGRDRGIVARVRLNVEEDGWIKRTGQKTEDGRQLLFEMSPAHRAVYGMLAKDMWLTLEDDRRRR